MPEPDMDISTCPHCKTRVVLSRNGECPSCRRNVNDPPATPGEWNAGVAIDPVEVVLDSASDLPLPSFRDRYAEHRRQRRIGWYIGLAVGIGYVGLALSIIAIWPIVFGQEVSQRRVIAICAVFALALHRFLKRIFGYDREIASRRYLRADSQGQPPTADSSAMPTFGPTQEDALPEINTE